MKIIRPSLTIFCSLYSLEKKGLNLLGIPRVVKVLTMEERRTDNLFFFLIFRLEVTGRFREMKKKTFLPSSLVSGNLRQLL